MKILTAMLLVYKFKEYLRFQPLLFGASNQRICISFSWTVAHLFRTRTFLFSSHFLRKTSFFLETHFKLTGTLQKSLTTTERRSFTRVSTNGLLWSSTCQPRNSCAHQCFVLIRAFLHFHVFFSVLFYVKAYKWMKCLFLKGSINKKSIFYFLFFF